MDATDSGGSAAEAATSGEAGADAADLRGSAVEAATSGKAGAGSDDLEDSAPQEELEQNQTTWKVLQW